MVWSEGMYLAPHHFQAQSRFFEDSVRFVADCFAQFNYGFLGLEIDEEELRRGSFLLHHLQGLMPDGLVFHASEKDDLPERRSVSELFPDTGKPLMLFLAIPKYQEGRQNVGPAKETGHNPARFTAREVEVDDFNSGHDLRKVDLLKHNLRVAAEREITPDDEKLPLARILRDGKGQFVLDPAYVPPCLRVSANSRLQFLLDRLLEVLSDKSRNLAERRKDAPSEMVRGDPRELVEFWLLHSVNSAIPILRQWKTGKSPHPAQLYLGLSQLAGALCTFGSDSEPATLPPYNHDALGDCFAALDEHIRAHLELGLPTNCVSITLERFQPQFFRGVIGDGRCFGKSRWVLAIKADVAETTLISRGPSLVKVSARDWIERVVRQAVPGAPLTYLPVPPASVPVRFGMVYFSIDRNHRLFEPIGTYRNIGIYIPGEFPNPEVELHIVIGEARS
jgi:type VI secretion system protein ImpJ